MKKKRPISSAIDIAAGARFWSESGVALIKCPICKYADHYQHTKQPEVIAGNDNYDAGWGGRGDLTVLPFWGECGHNWRICFGFHKGNTICWIESE